MIGSSRTIPLAVVSGALAVALGAGVGPMFADELAWNARAAVVGAAAEAPPLTIEVRRWSSEAERAPLLVALSAPPPEPPSASAGPAAGRGGRGGRGGAPPPSPAARLTAAIKSAPTVGFVWGDGPTGYSIKYAWRSALPDGQQRVVLAIDRRLGAHATTGPPAAAPATDGDFTVVEMRIDGTGAGEGKASFAPEAVIDAAAKTIALDGYEAAPVLLRVTE